MDEVTPTQMLARLRALHDAAREIGLLTDAAAIGAAVVRHARALLGVELAVLLLSDDEGREFTVQHVSGEAPGDLPPLDGMTIDPRCVVRRDRAVEIAEACPIDRRGAWAYREFAFAPLEVQGQIIGLLGIERRACSMCAAETEFLYLLGSVAAMALEQARARGEAVAEEKLRQRAQIPEANPFSVLLLEYDGTMQYLNPAARRLAGELGGPDEAIRQLLPPGFEARIQQLIDTDRTVMDAPHQVGERRLLLSYRPLPDTRQIFVTIVDDTERMRARLEVEAYAAKLERTNRELREAQLALVHSEKLAALGNVVAGIAHEMNTPVGALRANAQTSQQALLLLQQALAEPSAAHLLRSRPRVVRAVAALQQAARDAGVASERIGGIVASLRSFARIDESEFKKVDLREGVDATVTLLRHRIQGRIELELSCDGLPEVHCYPSQINQVFMHVLVNAIEAIERRGPHSRGTIHIACRREAEDVAIVFQDDGEGIAPELLPRVFDPGFTARRNITVGTGLGLSTSLRILQEHRGTIDIDSTPGRGTTVAVRLPIRGRGRASSVFPALGQRS